jgi:hypothetical protein
VVGSSIRAMILPLWRGNPAGQAQVIQSVAELPDPRDCVSQRKTPPMQMGECVVRGSRPLIGLGSVGAGKRLAVRHPKENPATTTRRGPGRTITRTDY